MKLFKCQVCGQLLYFENVRCERCGHQLGYIAEASVLSAVEADGSAWVALADRGRKYRFCANWELSACNWLLPADDTETFCLACRHNRTIPDLSDPERHRLWQRIEEAKRRLFYSIVELNLPAPTMASGDPEPLIFDFLADPVRGPKVMTGHQNGLITLSLSEAEDAWREKMRINFNEPYRTLLGHMRHEVGHYYWDRLVRDGGQLDGFRALFGDEQQDYGEALNRYYAAPAPVGWQGDFISAYGTAHPWEDWAETFAHYLHIVDTLEMAAAFGIRAEPEVAADPSLRVRINFDPRAVPDVSVLVDAWLPLAFAVNAMNRAMGQPDLYPFVLGPGAIRKLGYVHSSIRPFRNAAPKTAPAGVGSSMGKRPSRSVNGRS